MIEQFQQPATHPVTATSRPATLDLVKAGDLTTDQREKLLEAVAKRRDYFAKLVERMQARQWHEADPVYLAALAARDAAQTLAQAVYESRQRPPDPPTWMSRMGK